MTRIVALLFVLAIGLIVGCSSDKVAARDGVLDVSRSPAPAAAPVPSAEPVAAAPVPAAEPVFTAPTPVSAEPVSVASAGKTYTVKKGDTLFSIAKANYGTGRDWQKIASANPGLTPARLKAGQQIVIP